MKHKDVIKQESGAQQGNLHVDADEGRNETGRQGSTLDKGITKGQNTLKNDDDNTLQSSDTPSHGGKQEDTLGNP